VAGVCSHTLFSLGIALFFFLFFVARFNNMYVSVSICIYINIADQNGNDNVLKNYTLNDLRISIVYRARCFETEEEASEFRAQLHGKDGEDGRYSLNEILNTFVDDLKGKGYLSSNATLENYPRLDLAMMIMKVYIKYPLPPTPTIPWNYCAADKLVGWLKYPLSLVC